MPFCPGWRPKPQYIATPKSSRYLDAVSWRTAEAVEPVDWQDDPQEYAGVRRAQAAQRLEEAAVGAAQVPGAGEVQPVDLASGVIHRVVGHPHEQFHVSRLVHRPGRERSVAEVVADQRLLGYQPGDAPDRPGEALPAVAVGPREHALDVEDLPAHVPLDREVIGGDRGGQPLDLPGEQVLIGPQRDREVMRPVRLEHGK